MNGTCYLRKVVARKPKIKYKYYHLKSNHVITNKTLIRQLEEIKIPATYTNVVVCPSPKNRLQGTGYDGTGRKQYFYSKKHLEEAREEKYSNLIFLGMNLPKIMKDIDRLSKQSRPNLDTLNAMALKIMLLCNFRVGSQNNQKKYGTYGLSTLKTDHVSFKNGGKTALIKFNGKKQMVNECTLKDKTIVSMLKKLVDHNRKTKGKYLFSWGDKRASPDSLNDFLGSYHPDITTKTWRTWFANIRYLTLMRQEKENPEGVTKRRRLSNQVVKKVAGELHHTPAICKKNYLMTELTDLYVDKPSRWKLGKNQSPDTFFTNFLKSHYSISKDWIRKRSRSRSKARSRSRSRSRIGGAMGGPTWKPELAKHQPGYTGQLRKNSKGGGGKKKAVSRKRTRSISRSSSSDSYDEDSYDSYEESSSYD